MRVFAVLLTILMTFSQALAAKKCNSQVQDIANHLSELRVALTYEDTTTERYKDLHYEYSATSIALINETDRVDRCLGLNLDDFSDYE